MKKSGLADSPIFHPVIPETTSGSETIFTSPPVEPIATPPSHHAIMTPSNRDTVIPRHHDAIEIIRKAVREIGKEAATQRYTSEEKRSLKELVYTYGQQGVKTSENEISRIALNHLLVDFRKNGETSILHQVLTALNG